MIKLDTVGIVSSVYKHKSGNKAVDVTCPVCFKFTENVAVHFSAISCMNCGATLHQTKDTVDLKDKLSYVNMHIMHSIITRLRAMNIGCASEYISGDGWVYISVTSRDFDKLYNAFTSYRRYAKVRRKLKTPKMGGNRTIDMRDVLPYIPDFPYKSFDTIVHIGEGLSDTYVDRFKQSGQWVFKWRDTSCGAPIVRTFSNKEDAYNLRDFLNSLVVDYTVSYMPLKRY